MAFRANPLECANGQTKHLQAIDVQGALLCTPYRQFCGFAGAPATSPVVPPVVD